jgi:hypothetical protein
MTWLPGYERIPGNNSGTWTGPGPAKLVLHSTEGGSIEGAVAAYRANNSWPHCTVDPWRRRLVQHVPLNQPARALKNTSAPGETNRLGVVIQVEIVMTARTVAPKGMRSVTELTGEDLDWLGTAVIGPMCRGAGVPLTTSVQFLGDRAGFTLASTTARQRLSRQAWEAYAGVLGHQHVPENSHWDPGPLDIDRVLSAARGLKPTTPPPAPTPDPKDWLDMATKQELSDLIDERLTAALGASAQNQVAKDMRSTKRHAVDGVAAPKGTPADKLTFPQRAIAALARIEAALARIEAGSS